jgi:hypothetical protein
VDFFDKFGLFVLLAHNDWIYPLIAKSNYMSPQQLHKRLSLEQVKVVIESYLTRQVSLGNTLASLGIKKSRFYKLIHEYKNSPANFTIDYERTASTRGIGLRAEQAILAELEEEKKLIEDKNIPIKYYNYSALKDNLSRKQVWVSLPTIINRAKDLGYYQEKRERKIHDREVLTNLIGELVQHDSSHHQWSPYIQDKYYLITSLDDYSRMILFADLFERETTWTHIYALKSVFLQYGCPLKYYADQHAIFRYVKDRDKNSPWYNYTKFTDDVDPQWKQVLKDCQVDTVYALSPEAKGKIERPYRWLQDRLVRTAARQQLTTLDQLRYILKELVEKYNTEWVHSTTKEIPIIRFERARENQKSLFKPLQIPKPYEHLNDIFCLRAERTIDAYRKVSLAGLELQVPKGMPKEKVQIKLIPDMENGLTEIRFWQNNLFLGRYQTKSEDLKLVQF